MPNREDFVLCFVRDRCAWFTSLPVAEQHGDEWHRRNYRQQASEPYCFGGHEIVQVYYEGDFQTPADIQWDCPYSVDAINAGHVAWLRWDDGSDRISIMAGTTLRDFCRVVADAGGRIFLEPSDFIVMLDNAMEGDVPEGRLKSAWNRQFGDNS